jgi:tight adherence protein B
MKNNMRGFIVGLALLLLVFAPLQTVFAQDNGAHIRITQVDNSRFPQVTVYVSVTNAAGEPLGVDPNRFQVLENGQLVKADQISGSGDIGPLTTLLVMDVSGSMYDAGKLTAAKAAAKAYIEQMRPGDQAGLLTFNTKVFYIQAITTDPTALNQSIDSLDARGDTTLFDALDQAAQILKDIPGRKAIIVLTDGLDNRSTHTADQVVQAIGAGGLSISTIGLGDPSKLGINSGLDQTILRSLAARAGGVYGYANDPAALRGLYEQYGRALQSEYRFTYTTSSALRDGLSRTLTVSLGGSDSTQASYNPGGVLPEVSHPASWPVFASILVVLVGLLFIPGLAGRIQSSGDANVEKNVVGQHSPRIKFK